MKVRWLSEDDLVTVNGKTRVMGGVENTRHGSRTGAVSEGVGRKSEQGTGRGAAPDSRNSQTDALPTRASKRAAAYQSLSQDAPQRVERPAPSLSFVLFGQLPGGKNRVKNTRTGHRYPDKRFVDWRDEACRQLHPQKNGTVLYGRVALHVDYWAGDKRTRDVDAMLGALGHLFVRAGIMGDDGQIKDVYWKDHGLDRKKPRAELTLTAPSGRARDDR